MILLSIRKVDDYVICSAPDFLGTAGDSAADAVTEWFEANADALASLTLAQGEVRVYRRHDETCDLDSDCTCVPT